MNFKNFLTEEKYYAEKSKKYAGSQEFTDDWLALTSGVKQMKKLVSSPAWTAWLKLTDEHARTTCVQDNQAVKKALQDLSDALLDLSREIDKADKR